MTTDTPTTTPEPGQHVYVEAEVVEQSGHAYLRPIRNRECVPPALIRADLVVWHPADVPPQPPVLANGTPVMLSGSETPYVISAIENHCDGLDCRQMTVRLWTHHSAAEKLADVPGPDDTTPTAEPEQP